MVELVEFIVKELVDDKEKVKVTSITNADSTEVISINVATEDIGKIIGKQGRIAMAIRTVIKAVGVKRGLKYSVEIIDNKE